MLSKVHLQRYAQVLLWGLKIARNKTFKKGDVILVRYHIPALPLAEILYARLMEMGMNAVMRLSPTPNMEKSFFMISNRRQLTFQPPGEKELYRNLNGSIFLHAPESITHLSKIDPKKIGSHTLALKPLRDIMDRRESQGLFSWTLCMLPTSQLAKHAGLTMKSYTDQIVKACWLHRRDPVSHWNEIYKEAQLVKKWLNRMSVKHYRVESKNVDLVVTPGAQRRWIGISGHNIPSFELFLSPDWRGSNGIYYAD